MDKVCSYRDENFRADETGKARLSSSHPQEVILRHFMHTNPDCYLYINGDHAVDAHVVHGCDDGLCIMRASKSNFSESGRLPIETCGPAVF